MSPKDTVKDYYSYEYWQPAIQQLFEPILKQALRHYERVDVEVFLTKPMDIQTFEPDAASFVLFVAMGAFLEGGKRGGTARTLV